MCYVQKFGVVPAYKSSFWGGKRWFKDRTDKSELPRIYRAAA